MPLCPANAHVLPPAITNMENFHCRPDSDQPRREHPNTGHKAPPLQLTLNGATSLHDEIEREAVLNYAKANPGASVAEFTPTGWRIIYPPQSAICRPLQHLTTCTGLRRVYRVTRITRDMDEANRWCADHPGESVIDELDNGVCIIAGSQPIDITERAIIRDAINNLDQRGR